MSKDLDTGDIMKYNINPDTVLEDVDFIAISSTQVNCAFPDMTIINNVTQLLLSPVLRYVITQNTNTR